MSETFFKRKVYNKFRVVSNRVAWMDERKKLGTVS